MASWHTVARVGEVDSDCGKQLEIGGRCIALFHYEGDYYAIGGECTHAGGPLAEGYIEADRIICPLHGAEFEIKTGKNCSPPASRDVACYPVRVEGDAIQVQV